MNSRRRALLIAATSMALLPCANAQEYPNRPVKLIVGYVAGGGPDVVARVLAQKLTDILGQPFVVENRPGAGATLASGVVARSPADGYTLMVGETGQLVIAPYTYKNLSYNTLKDFAPIALVTSEAVLLVSNPKSGIKTLQDLIREAKANPGKLSYGSSGVGTIHHISTEAFAAGLGLDLQHVPYKGSGQSVPGILAGDVPVVASGYGGVIAHIRSGALNLLAVTTANRLPALPDTPSLSEVIKGYDFPSDTGLLAPAGVPPAVVSKLAAAVKQAMDSPEFANKFKNTGITLNYKSPVDYAEHLKVNLKKYEVATGQARIQPE